MSQIIYRETQYGSFFDCLFTLMKKYLKESISVRDFGILRHNSGLREVKELFKFFFKSNELKKFDSIFKKFANQYDQTLEYLNYFSQFLQTPFVKSCLNYNQLQEELASFEKALQRHPILGIVYPQKFSQLKQNYISLITSKIFLNIINKIFYQKKPKNLKKKEYLNFGNLSFDEIEHLLKESNDYMEQLFDYSKNQSLQKSVIFKDVQEIFHEVDSEKEVNIFKIRYDTSMELLFDLYKQKRFVEESLNFAESFEKIYNFFELKERQISQKLIEFNYFFKKKGANTNFWEIQKRYSSMRFFLPKNEEQKIPEWSTNLELCKVNPFFLLVENQIDAIYYLQILSEKIELTVFLMEIYKKFLDSFEGKISLLKEEIETGDYSIKNFHLNDCIYLIRNLKEVSSQNFISDYQLFYFFLINHLREGKVRMLPETDLLNKYPNSLRILNIFSRNSIFKKDYTRQR